MTNTPPTNDEGIVDKARDRIKEFRIKLRNMLGIGGSSTSSNLTSNNSSNTGPVRELTMKAEERVKKFRSRVRERVNRFMPGDNSNNNVNIKPMYEIHDGSFTPAQNAKINVQGPPEHEGQQVEAAKKKVQELFV